MSATETPGERLAAALAKARIERTPIAAGDLDHFAVGLGEAEAYDVQSRIAAIFGPVEAWKTGRKSEAEPVIAAPVLSGGLRPSGSAFSTQELGACGIELEIAFRLEADLPPRDAPDFEARLRDVVTPMAVIEVVDGRMESFVEASALLKLADNQINAGLVFADAGMPDFESFDAADVALSFDGQMVVEGRRSVPGGDALSVLVAFARMIGDHCGGLRKGQIVTTGSLTGLLFVPPGTTVEGRIAGLGTVTTRFA